MISGKVLYDHPYVATFLCDDLVVTHHICDQSDDSSFILLNSTFFTFVRFYTPVLISQIAGKNEEAQLSCGLGDSMETANAKLVGLLTGLDRIIIISPLLFSVSSWPNSVEFLYCKSR